jgi:hypothetical protein
MRQREETALATLARANRCRWSSLLVVASLSVTAGCGDPLDSRPRARQTAVNSVRAGAEAAQHDLNRILQDPPAVSQEPAALSDRVRAELAGSYGTAHDQILAVTADPGRTVRAQLVLYAQGEAGGGLDYESVTVRLCVALQGTAGPAASAELDDAPCPSEMPSPGPYVGTVDETVRLTD